MWLQIVDRPTQGHKFLSRQYVQPQWVFDSANFRVLAKAELYAVGLVPPPHLSPFVQNDEEGYVPDYLQTMLKLQVSSCNGYTTLPGIGALVDLFLSTVQCIEETLCITSHYAALFASGPPSSSCGLQRKTSHS